MEKTKKQKRLEALRDILKSGATLPRDHARMYVEDTDGTQVALSSAEALPAIERRLAELEDGNG